MQQLGQITNADAYANGNDLKGLLEEFGFGDIGYTEVEHKALGMVGVVKLPGRPLQAIDGELGFSWLDEKTERDLLDPTKRHKFQLHSYVDVFDESGLNHEKSHTLVTHVGFHTMKRGGFSSKLGDGAKVKHSISIQSFSQKVYGDSTPIVEFDVWSGLYKINGKDVWPR